MRWEVLAAINEIETDYGRNLNVSTAGALGLDAVHAPDLEAVRRRRQQATASRTPSTRSTRSSPPRATCKAAGAEQDLRRAIFAYNHADWYVDSVLMRARLIGGLPSNFVGSLTGPDPGPLPGRRQGHLRRRLHRGGRQEGQTKSRGRVTRALVVEGSTAPPRIKIFARRGAPVIAVNDGRIVRIGQHQAPRPASSSCRTPTATPTRTRTSPRSPSSYPAPKPRTTTQKQIAKELALPAKDAAPTAPASATTQTATKRRPAAKPNRRASARQGHQASPRRRSRASPTKQRLFAHPQRPERRARRRPPAGVPAHRQASTAARASAATSRGLRPRPQGRQHQAPAPGLAHHRRHDPRPHRQDRQRRGPARAVRDPPGRPRRPAHRPEADPRRLEAARVDRDLPRRRQEPVLRPRRRAARRSARSC